MEVPDQNRNHGVGCNGDCHQHQRQSPYLDVVGKEHGNRQADDCNQPALGRVDTLRVLHRVRYRQSVGFRKLDLGRQTTCDQLGSLPGDLIDQTHGFDFHHIGGRYGYRGDQQCNIQCQTKASAHRRAVSQLTPQRMLQRDDNHHQGKGCRIEIFVGILANNEVFKTKKTGKSIIYTGDTRHSIQQTNNH